MSHSLHRLQYMLFEFIFHCFQQILLYCNLPKSQITRLQLIQNSPARAVVKASKSCHITPVLRSLHWLKTRHRAGTSIYSLTFCVRVMSQERHHWKPAVQAAAVMLRTPPLDGQLPASQHTRFPYTARNFENAAVTRRSPASSVRTPRRAFAICRHITG